MVQLFPIRQAVVNRELAVRAQFTELRIQMVQARMERRRRKAANAPVRRLVRFVASVVP